MTLLEGPFPIENIVLSKNKNLKIDSVEVFNSPKDVIDFYKKNSEQYVIGGNYIYEPFFEYCEYLCITYVDKEHLEMLSSQSGLG